MPRLSVDIDLTYLPLAARPESLAAIDAAMRRLAQVIRGRLRRALGTEVPNAQEQTITKLVVRRDAVQIKIEVTPVLRGCVFAPESRAVARRVEAECGYARTQVVSFADLYAGKIVAALDRQHPRDLFDVRELLKNEGIASSCAAHSSSTSSATTGLCPKCSPRREETSRRSSRAASSA